MTNEQFASEDTTFKTACAAAGTLATKRQASKFRRGHGIAYKTVKLQDEQKKQDEVKASLSE